MRCEAMGKGQNEEQDQSRTQAKQWRWHGANKNHTGEKGLH